MAIDPSTLQQLTARAISAPLVTHLYTADPSAHVFEGRIYIYPSHDIDAGIPANDLGDQYAMEDYHVFCQDSPDGEARDCGAALHVRDVPWAAGQMWAPDAATRDGRYYLYFPAKRADGVFQIGVAMATRPEGPFTPDPEPILGSYSIDPAVLADDDGETLLEFYANDSGEYPQLGHWSFHIAFNSDDLAASRDQLVAAGGTSVSDIITLGNGDQTTFVRDPWGIHVQLIRRIKPLEV